MKAVAAVFLLCLSCLARASEVEIFNLRYRTADEVVPMLRSLVGKDSAVTGMQNQVVVRGTAAELSQIRNVLKQVDVVPRRLMITVRQTLHRGGDRQGASVSVGPAAGAEVYSTRSLERSADTQQVQAMDGRPALIRMGKSVPVPSRQVIRSGSGTAVVDSTEYRDVTTGFYVVPRVTGDQVTLEVRPQREREEPGHRFDVQGIVTTVSGRLGEWIDVGGAVSDRGNEGAGTVYSTRDLEAERRGVQLKVEELR